MARCWGAGCAGAELPSLLGTGPSGRPGVEGCTVLPLLPLLLLRQFEEHAGPPPASGTRGDQHTQHVREALVPCRAARKLGKMDMNATCNSIKYAIYFVRMSAYFSYVYGLPSCCLPLDTLHVLNTHRGLISPVCRPSGPDGRTCSTSCRPATEMLPGGACSTHTSKHTHTWCCVGKGCCMHAPTACSQLVASCSKNPGSSNPGPPTS